MKLIDLHCDTLYRMKFENICDIKDKRLSVNLEGMKKSGVIAQFFACYTDAERIDGNYDQGYRDVLSMIRILEEQCSAFSEQLALSKSCEEAAQNERMGKISAILTVEEGGILNGEIKRLEELYERGVRLLTLLWNYENCLGFPNSPDREKMAKGLKPFGVEVTERAGEMGMIVDVSHASDQSFWDIMAHAKGPVVASHSNCRALACHPRNLSDEMIRALAEKGGIAGLNFYGPFLGRDSESRLEDMGRHLQHMLDVGGEDFPAIGTDLDGFDGMHHQDIPDIGCMERLWDHGKSQGMSERILDKIFRGNAGRIIQYL